MTDSAPIAVVDALSSLLEAETNSIFRFLEEGSPYLDRASAELRRPIRAMAHQSERHARELSDVIESLGGSAPRRRPRPDEQYLAYLSFRFLLPKLVEEKALSARRYRNALGAIEKLAPAAVVSLLRTHLADHEADLTLLRKAAGPAAEPPEPPEPVDPV